MLGLALPSAARAAEWHDGASGYDSAVFEQQHTHQAMVVYFHTDWCGYCKLLDSKVLSDRTVMDFLGPLAKVKINPETSPEAEKLARTFGVSGYPSVFVVLPGKAPEKIAAYGGNPPAVFIRQIQRVVGSAAPASGRSAEKEKEKDAAAPESLKVKIPSSLLPDLPPDVVDLQARGRHQMAVVTLTEEIRRAKRNGVKPKPGWFYARALSYRAMHKHSDAAADLEEYLRAEPDDVAAREVLARSYLNVTMYSDAAIELEKIVKEHPNAERFFLLGEAYSKDKKPERAKHAYGIACDHGYKPACGK